MNSLKIVPKSTALIVIDLQNGITGRSNLGPHTAQQVVRTCANLASRVRERGGTVFYVRVDLKNFLALDVDVPSRDPNAPPPPDSASDLVENSGRTPQDFVITKRTWSAFPGTSLEKDLRAHGIRTIIMSGIATNFGVESTAREAAGLGFNLIFAEDAMTSHSAPVHRFAIETIFPRLGRVRSSEEILTALQ